jgi:hypothetical protein
LSPCETHHLSSLREACWVSLKRNPSDRASDLIRGKQPMEAARVPDTAVA